MAEKSLKIGIVLDTSLDPTDGVQQYVLAIGEWLRSKGHDVHYLVGESNRNDVANVHSLTRNFTVRFNGNRTTIPLPTSKRKLRAFLRQHDFDILHVQTPHNPFMAQHLMMAASPKTAVVATFHVLPDGRLPAIANRALGIWLKPSLRRIDRFISVSPAAATFAKRTFRITGEVLPNVVDYQHFHRAKPLTKYNDDRLTILFLGRLVPRKGCMLLLQSIAELQRRAVDLPPFRVVICGRGGLEKELREYVQRHQLQDIVEFTGFVSEADKPRYYASADISVFPSRAGESFGIVLLEAMASGKAAVLAGDNPGYRSVMEPRAELLFDPRSASTLADALSGMLTDPQRRKAAATWGTEYTASFDINLVGERLLKIYKEALRKRRQKEIMPL